MTFLEWRKFPFFDLKKNADNGRIAEAFKEDTSLTASSYGNNHIVLCDSSGLIHLVSRSWSVSTFRGYEVSVELAFQVQNSPILVTIGHDEAGVNPLIKVWDTSRLDKNGTAHCFRISRAVPGNRPVQVSALSVHENLQLMAVGFVDGSLVLYRGDITRERSSKQKLLRDASSTVTGLAFKNSASNIYLFLATDSSVFVYNVSHKDKEHKFSLDNIGCAKKCSVLSESIQESHFMVGRNDAIYCYTSDGRGPCYAVDGEKIMLEWFRNYLIIISKDNRSTGINTITSGNITNHSANVITVLDIYNKFIVFSATVPKIRALLNEFGSFFILDEDNKVYQLDEKDLQSKLTLLFKKNLYDVAIRIAKSQQYDNEGLVDIFKQYGDHLCTKSDFCGAIEQYIKTIGKLEPSYVIRKFLDSQHIEKLTMYLLALHKQKQATEDHTTLLLNCYTKLSNTIGQNDGLKRNDSLKEFILSKDADITYDIDVAIKVCRHGSPEEALMLAKKHEKHDWYIKLLIEDHEKYLDVLEYISNLSLQNAENFMQKYGSILISKIPHESTQFLKRLCTNYKPNNTTIIAEAMSASTNDFLIGNYDIPERSDPEEFIHLFLDNSERLLEFLEYLISEGQILTRPVYNTLLEHYLSVWKNKQNVSEKEKYALKILKLLQNPDIKYDKSQALVVCHMYSFSEGILYLYEEQKLYQQILRHHISKNDSNSILACCRRFGNHEPTLWVQALWSCVKNPTHLSTELLNEILTVVAKEKLLSPQLVIEAISTSSTAIQLGHIRSYLTNELQQEHKKTKEISELTEKYRKDTDKLKKQLDNLKNGTVVIQGSRCAACQHQLELPTLHFMCQHSYHQHCFQSFSDEEQECPACQPENKNLIELLKAREYNKDLDEIFHHQLEKAHDGFSIAAEYFGRGVFTPQFKLIGPKICPKLDIKEDVDFAIKTNFVPPTKKDVPKIEVKNYGPGAEGRMRQTEFKPTKQILIPESEGRMRLSENKYSSSMDPGILHKSKANVAPSVIEKRKLVQKEVEGPNPFEDYDEAKDPFFEEYDNEKDPFYEEGLP